MRKALCMYCIALLIALILLAYTKDQNRTKHQNHLTCGTFLRLQVAIFPPVINRQKNYLQIETLRTWHNTSIYVKATDPFFVCFTHEDVQFFCIHGQNWEVFEKECYIFKTNYICTYDMMTLLKRFLLCLDSGHYIR